MASKKVIQKPLKGKGLTCPEKVEILDQAGRSRVPRTGNAVKRYSVFG
jgi:hypothetical protein